MFAENATKRGVAVPGALVTLAAAGVANTGTLFQISNYAAQVGVKTAKILKVRVSNFSGVDTYLYIGTGLGGALFAQAIPRIKVITGFSELVVDNNAEFAADITGYVDNASCEVQLQVLEVG